MQLNKLLLKLNVLKFTNWYTKIAVIVLNSIVLLLIIELFLQGFYAIKDSLKSTKSIAELKYPHVDFNKVYPNKSKDEINKLLLETWNRTYAFDYKPFVQFSEHPIQGNFVTVNEYGLRNFKDYPIPIDTSYFNIFMFGGSTTFGYGVTDKETIAFWLEKNLQKIHNKKVKVYNWGCGNYYSSQESALFITLLKNGIVPQMAIFIDGLNEAQHPFADEPKFTQTLYALMQKNVIVNFKKLEYIGLIRFTNTILNLLQPKTVETSYKSNCFLLVNRYLQNKKIIKSVAAAYGVTCIFSLQPITHLHFNPNQNLFVQTQNDIPNFNLLQNFYNAFTDSIKQSENIVDLTTIRAGFLNTAFVDQVHYNEDVHKLLANHLAIAVNAQLAYE